MPDLNFEVVGAEFPNFAAVPTLIFQLKVSNAGVQERIHSIALRSQVMIMATQRQYSGEAQARLGDIYGESKRWGETLRSLLWTHNSTVVPGFVGSTILDLPIACTYDFEVVSTKYFAALEDGEVPLSFLFSGTIFYTDATDRLQVGQVSWSKEATYRLPVSLWQAMIAQYYPNSAWIQMRKDVFDQLYQYKVDHGVPTWEEVFERLLEESKLRVQP